MDASTAIGLLKQQIVDGAKRIEHQRTVVQSLRADGHANLAEEADDFLGKLVELQANYVDQLARLAGPSQD